ncbi:MAG TPA: hypothetical protein VJ992_10905, partial [Gemmatimonadales bacterium]|nr:hypothetical protein [Gemmatimonadales bacterium]
MYSRVVACVGTLACVLGARVSAAQSTPMPQQQIQHILDQQMAAANAHDTDRFLASYLHDSTLVMVFNGEITTGFDSVRALQLMWWKHGKSDVVYSRRGPVMFK